ncbi:MAG: hypothetical protein QNJ37_23010 [Crocosphaera sp.]|nr:hypothetical protein [Crocosphaera sp.]
MELGTGLAKLGYGDDFYDDSNLEVFSSVNSAKWVDSHLSDYEVEQINHRIQLIYDNLEVA